MAKLAVISDLHCHPGHIRPADTFLLTDMLRSPTKFHPVQSLLDLIEREGISADALLVGGDLTNKINQQGLLSGWSFAKEIATALKTSTIAATIGNHDVDSRHDHSNDPFYVARSFSPADFPVRSEVDRNKFWQKGFFLTGTGDTTILVVNSVLTHHTQEEAKRGAISLENLEALGNELSSTSLAKFKVALVHHHPIPHENLGLGSDDLMENGSLLLEQLSRFDFHIVVHGHKHYPRLRYSDGGASAPTVFAAGSLCAINSQMLSNTRNLFHYICLEEALLDDCAKHGLVYSWEYNSGKGWSPPSLRSADFPAIAGFGCRAPAKLLAEKTAALFHFSPGEFKRWDQVTSVLPQIKYFLPSDLEEFGLDLRRRFGLITYPAIPETPGVIGRP